MFAERCVFARRTGQMRRELLRKPLHVILRHRAGWEKQNVPILNSGKVLGKWSKKNKIKYKLNTCSCLPGIHPFPSFFFKNTPAACKNQYLLTYRGFAHPQVPGLGLWFINGYQNITSGWLKHRHLTQISITRVNESYFMNLY